MQTEIQIIQFTKAAIDEIKRLMQVENFNTNLLLRIGVKGGGCSGMTYILEFELPKENDEIFEVDGITCCMEKSHKIYLYNMEIDWQNGLNNRGFIFKNPNASKTCGCGTSFAV